MTCLQVVDWGLYEVYPAFAMPDQVKAAERGFFLRFMHNLYAVYLGVTPPSPENEKKIAAVVVGGTAILVIFLLFFVRFLLSSIFSR